VNRAEVLAAATALRVWWYGNPRAFRGEDEWEVAARLALSAAEKVRRGLEPSQLELEPRWEGSE
jgi:hypothetical protein